jgi:hypothetical protein
MSEGLLTQLDGCLCLLGTFAIELHSFLAQYFELLIVYICSLLVEIPLWQSQKHHKANNDVFTIL